MFELSVRTHFSAAHHLRDYVGKCANPHGHNWMVEVAVRGTKLDKAGILIDFKDLKAEMEAFLDKLDHTDLNVNPLLKGLNPTSENIARFLFEALADKFEPYGCTIHYVAMDETPDARVIYYGTKGAP